MDPCPFVRVIIESLALRLPQATKPAGSGVHPTATPCFCKLRIKNFPSQTALLPLCSSSNDTTPPDSSTTAAGFDLDSATLRRFSGKSLTLRVSVYTGRMGRTCGINGGKLLGKVNVTIELNTHGGEYKPAVFQNGWMKLGSEPGRPSARIHVVVRTEPDPRFVFQFGGEPECSPVVYQIQGNIRQPVFSCKFSADRNARSRSLPADFSTNRGWITRTFSGEKDRASKERKGWMIMVYDLSGSPVAAASMITPFVASTGSDRVSRSNPGAWLVLRPHGNCVSSWKPWGRLEAWRERGHVDGLGYKFELVTDKGPSSGIPLAEATLSVKKGGKFCIDSRTMRDCALSSRFKGFVMGSTVEGEGKISKPMVHVGMQHVTCTADAALFIALSAAIDLSMDACRLFTHKLRKELCHDDQDSFT